MSETAVLSPTAASQAAIFPGRLLAQDRAVSRPVTSLGPTPVLGAGAAFPAPLYFRWFEQYGEQAGISVEYRPVGSAAGIEAIRGRAVDFGASDYPMEDDQIARAPNILHIPMVIGVVALAYNLAGVPDHLRLSSDVIAEMFLGTVTRWNDPRIAELNPEIRLPPTQIRPIAAGGSGARRAVAQYLSGFAQHRVSHIPKEADLQPPASGAGSAAGASALRQTEGSIGCIDLVYARSGGLQTAAIGNRCGQFVPPSVVSAIAAVGTADVPADLRMTLIDSEAHGAYPIAFATYLLVHHDARPEVKELIQWALHLGDADAAALDYAPLPKRIKRLTLDAVNRLA